ncbi:MAG: TolC family protein, partial [Bacteroidaceae bacterium]|nr:TolC family protein [Bacteroidaceae bacterium]
MFKPLLLLLLAIPIRSSAQTLDDIFALVQQNNLSLRTYEAQCNAAKAQARAGISIADPEVEFGYLWGRPGEIGTRKDVAVSQSFDFATLFGARRRQARSRAELADLELQQARNLVLFAAQQNVIDLTYANNRVELRQQRLATAQQLCSAYEQLLREGEVSKLSSTRAQLERATAEAELRRA